jgi:hypothetical protein
MDALGAGLAALVGNIESAHGVTTLVNGTRFPGGAGWGEAAASRVTMYFGETLLGRSIYEVVFAGAGVLSAPYLLAYNSELTWVVTGWKFVVKKINLDTVNDTVVGVSCLVEQMAR